MVVDYGVWLVYVAISEPTHAQDCPASQFPAEIGKIGTLKVLSFGNWPPSQISSLCEIAWNIFCQCILDGIELVVAYILADKLLNEITPNTRTKSRQTPERNLAKLPNDGVCVVPIGCLKD